MFEHITPKMKSRMEYLDKIALAKETFKSAGIEQYIELIEGDAVKNLQNINNIAFCFLDIEKELYQKCWEIISTKIVPGGILVADNLLSNPVALKPFAEKVQNDSSFDSIIIPIGKGELVCRKILSQ